VIRKSVLFITNGNQEIGYGHVARSLCIAEEFASKNYEIVFLILKDSPFRSRIHFKNVFTVDSFSIHSKAAIGNILTQLETEIAIIDLIEKEYDMLFWIRKEFPRLYIVTITLFLFDFQKRYEHLSFFPSMASGETGTFSGKYGSFVLCQGKSYFPFRREFKNIVRTQNKDAKKVLISMGGSDPYNLTALVLGSITLSDLSVSIILSPVAESFQEVQAFIYNNKAYDLRLVENTNNIAAEMCTHDILILNGGLTRYEACLAQIPFIAISIHETQFNITQLLADQGIGINLGIGRLLSAKEINTAVFSLLQDYPLRRKMTAKMREILDPDGAERIIDQIISGKSNFSDEKND